MAKPIHPVFELFRYDAETNISICRVADCQFPNMTGHRSYNLVSHVKRRHKHYYQRELNEKIEEYLTKRPKLKRKSSIVSVKLDREDILLGFLELLVINCRPFRMLKDSGMRRILRPILESFKGARVPISTDPDYLKNQACRVQEIIKNKIKSEFKGRLVSLQLDIATRLQRRILGVNVHYYEKDKSILRTIGMKQMNESTESLVIALEVEKILNEFDSQVDDIYAVTTDNGSNVLGCAPVLRIMQEGRLRNFVSMQNINTVNMETLNELIEMESSRISRRQSLHFVHQIHCSLHTLNLAIGDALSAAAYTQLFERCRELSKELRKPSIHNLITKKNLKSAVLDCPTRWNTSYEMVCAVHLNVFIRDA